jgi:hypothetical protein
MRHHQQKNRLNRRAFREMERIATVISDKQPLTMDCNDNNGNLMCARDENGRSPSISFLSTDIFDYLVSSDSHNNR